MTNEEILNQIKNRLSEGQSNKSILEFIDTVDKEVSFSEYDMSTAFTVGKMYCEGLQWTRDEPPMDFEQMMAWIKHQKLDTGR